MMLKNNERVLGFSLLSETAFSYAAKNLYFQQITKKSVTKVLVSKENVGLDKLTCETISYLSDKVNNERQDFMTIASWE